MRCEVIHSQIQNMYCVFFKPFFVLGRYFLGKCSTLTPKFNFTVSRHKLLPIQMRKKILKMKKVIRNIVGQFCFKTIICIIVDTCLCSAVWTYNIFSILKIELSYIDRKLFEPQYCIINLWWQFRIFFKAFTKSRLPSTK